MTQCSYSLHCIQFKSSILHSLHSSPFHFIPIHSTCSTSHSSLHFISSNPLHCISLRSNLHFTPLLFTSNPTNSNPFHYIIINLIALQSTPIWLILSQSIHSTRSHSISSPFQFTSFASNPFLFTLNPFLSIPINSCPLHSTPLHSISINYTIPTYFNQFQSVQFNHFQSKPIPACSPITSIRSILSMAPLICCIIWRSKWSERLLCVDCVCLWSNLMI